MLNTTAAIRRAVKVDDDDEALVQEYAQMLKQYRENEDFDGPQLTEFLTKTLGRTGRDIIFVNVVATAYGEGARLRIGTTVEDAEDAQALLLGALQSIQSGKDHIADEVGIQ